MKAYLDNNATTRTDPEVVEAMKPYFLDAYGNASSMHGFGQEARKAVEEAREKVAALINCEPGEIIFTSGGTESDNQAIRGVTEKYARKGNHVITSAIEHPAVLESCVHIQEKGYNDISYISTDAYGVIKLEDLKAAIADKTILITVMLANNESGVIQPVKEIAEIAHRKDIVIHTDAVQAIGKIKVDVQELGVDLLSLSAHKFHGPNGVGILYIRKGTKVASLMHGGSHERSLRAGTLNVPGIVGLGKAAEIAERDLDANYKKISALRDRLEKNVTSRVKFTRVNGHRENRLPNTTNISFEFVEGEGVMLSADLKGVTVSTGSACASGKLEASHVLIDMGLSHALAQGAIRFSLSKETTQEEVDYAVDVIAEAVERLRAMSPLYEDALKGDTSEATGVNN
jgi:cysteine desulfurase